MRLSSVPSRIFDPSETSPWITDEDEQSAGGYRRRIWDMQRRSPLTHTRNAQREDGNQAARDGCKHAREQDLSRAQQSAEASHQLDVARAHAAQQVKHQEQRAAT